jgi:hypothetical protein
MKTVFCLLTLAAVCAAVSGDNKGREGSKPREAGATAEAELKWAKGIVADFFDTVFASRTCDTLLAVETAKVDVFRNEVFVLGGAYSSASITSQELSPNHAQARFSGVLKADTASADFAIRLVKNRLESGKFVG